MCAGRSTDETEIKLIELEINSPIAPPQTVANVFLILTRVSHFLRCRQGILDHKFNRNSFYLLLVELKIFRFANFNVRTFCHMKERDDDDEE